jgi:cysteine desulfurase/selenocysteine lyase
VIDAITRAYAETYATVHRGVYQRSADMTLAFEAARERTARFIGAATDEIVFVRGATEGINLVAQSWGPQNLKPGDRIMLSMLEHHSNIVPWQLLAERTGAHIDVAPLTADHRIDLDAMAAMLTDRHKLVALAHVSNVLGSVLDARRAADLAHGVGAKLLLDGCQAVPRLPVDVTALGCDFYVFSGHKLYGPTGIGVLWGRAELLRAMPPWQGGGAMIDKVSFERTTYAPRPHGSRPVRPTSPARSASTPPSIMSRASGLRRSTRTRPPSSAPPATRSAASTACASTAPRTAPASSASASKGCIRTTSAPYWTRAGSRSARATIAPSR